jgi:hypothetical protein
MTKFVPGSKLHVHNLYLQYIRIYKYVKITGVNTRLQLDMTFEILLGHATSFETSQLSWKYSNM